MENKAAEPLNSWGTTLNNNQHKSSRNLRTFRCCQIIFLFKLAFKNLARYKKRTAVTSLSIAVGLAFYIYLDSMIIGSIHESEKNLFMYETGSGVIQSDSYWDEKDLLPLEYSIENMDKVRDVLNELEIPYAERTYFSADLLVYKDPFPEDGNIPVKVTAIDYENDNDVFKIQEALEKGRFPDNDEEGVVLGSWLAEDINADIGYPVTLVTRTKSGYFQVMDLEVTGIVNTTNPVVNRESLYISRGIAELYLEMEGSVTDIHLRINGRGNLPKTASMINEKLSGTLCSFHTWREMVPDFVTASEGDKNGTAVMTFILFIIVAVGISNTMLMAIYERVREIGMMRALGMKDITVKWLFRIEAAGIGLIGSSAGLLIGALANIHLVVFGIDYSKLMREGNYGYRMIGIMRGIWHTEAFITAFIIGIVFSFLISFLPTRKAMKKDIPSCIHDI